MTGKYIDLELDDGKDVYEVQGRDFVEEEEEEIYSSPIDTCVFEPDYDEKYVTRKLRSLAVQVNDLVSIADKLPKKNVELDKLFENLQLEMDKVHVTQQKKLDIVKYKIDKLDTIQMTQPSLQSGHDTQNDMEQRISKLEKIIGMHYLNTKDSINDQLLLNDYPSSKLLVQNAGSLTSALSQLEERVSLFTQPHTLEQLSKRITDISADFEKLIEIRKRFVFESTIVYTNDVFKNVNDSDLAAIQFENEKKINHLYQIMAKYEHVIDIVPHVVSRLHALQKIHSKAASFSESVDTVSKTQNAIEDTVATMNKDIKKLMESMQVNQERISKNIEALDNRIEEVQRRVENCTSQGNK
jgi:hypothetical protein